MNKYNKKNKNYMIMKIHVWLCQMIWHYLNNKLNYMEMIQLILEMKLLKIKEEYKYQKN